MSPSLKAQAQIQFCVLSWGFTAILGKLITLPAMALVWWRLLIVSALLACVPRLWRALRQTPRRLVGMYALIGVFVCLHWLTFYGAIKLANASVGATCIALAPVFLAFVEPAMTRRRFQWRELALGLLAVPGVALVVGGVPTEMHLGIAVGALSALLVAVFGSLNKRYGEHADPLLVTGIELGTGALVLALIGPLLPAAHSVYVLPSTHDFLLLLVLAVGCTLLPFTLFLVALRQVSTFSAQLSVNLEPVYTILLAIPLLGEQRELGLSFYVGVCILLGAVVAYPLLLQRKPQPHPELAATAESKSMVES